MRVCIDPRLFPGVRCSVLKTVKSWPSCWMTMPGRSCVALTLLIVFCVSLRSLLISEIPAGGPSTMPQPRSESLEAHRRIHVTSAKQQYRWRYSKRSIRLLRLSQAGLIIRSESCAFSRRGHAGVVDVHQAPVTLFLAIDLCFPAVGREGRAILSEPGCEIPVKLGPRGISVNMNGNVMNTQFAFRKGVAHQMHVDILLY